MTWVRTMGPAGAGLFFLVIASGTAAAQTPSPPARPALTLDQALELADRHNPALTGAQAAVDGAEARVTQARAYQNPTITAGAYGFQQERGVSLGTGIGGALHGVAVTQPLELPSVRRTRIRAAQEYVQGSQYAHADIRLAVHGAVKQAFYEVLRRRREIAVAQANVDLLDDLRRRIAVQVNVGEAAQLELIRADAETASATIALRASELRLLAASSALHAAVGTPLDAMEPAGELSEPPELPPLEILRQQLIARHPAIAAAEAAERASEELASHERALRLPQPGLWADWLHQPEVAQYRYGVSVTVPVWDRRAGAIAEADAARRQAEASVVQQRVTLLAALERAYNLYEIATEQVRIAETATVPQATAAVQAAETAFRLGERGILELLDAQRVLRAARLDHLNAQFDRQQALVELDQLRVFDLEGSQP